MQNGDLRWRPHYAYAQQWNDAELVVANEQAAAAAAAYDMQAAGGADRLFGVVRDAAHAAGKEGLVWSSISGMSTSVATGLKKVGQFLLRGSHGGGKQPTHEE